MIKKNKKILPFIATMCILMSTTMVQAGTTYTPVAISENPTFNKYLIMDAGDTVPVATFNFSVSPGTRLPASPTGVPESWTYNGTKYSTEAAAIAAKGNGDGEITHNAASQSVEVLAGIGTPTIAAVSFAASDTTETAAGTNIDVARTNEERGGTAGDTVQLDTGEKYATKQATINFSGIEFPEPGIYRYIISETAGNTSGIVYDTDTDRVLDVYVTDNGSGTLVVSSCVMHTDASAVAATTDMGSGDVATASSPLTDKTDGFTNEYTSKDLRVSKEVSGNQASRDKYFEIEITCTGIEDASKYVVSIANDSDNNTNDGSADATSGTNTATISENQGQTNSTEVTGAELKAGKKFYLQHGQNIVIRGLPPAAEYTVTEDAEDYKSTVMTGKTNTGTIGTVAGTGKIAEAGFTNTRDGIIPTGIFMTLGAAVAVLLIALLGISFVMKNNSKKNKELYK